MSSESHNRSPILSAISLNIGYKDKKSMILIARDINFEIKSGELVAIIGINGSGKSTLLKTLSGLNATLGGEILIQNTRLSTYSNHELSRIQSLVLTNESISKQLTVNELVALGRHPYTNWMGQLRPEDIESVNQALNQVDLIQKKDKLCHSLSDGQFQKALIARAIAQDTPLILMDEPTSHLDMYHKVYILQLLKSIVKTSNKSVIFASHEINLALQLCDKIILIHDAKVKFGTPSQLIENGDFNNLFPSQRIVFDENTNSFRMKI